MPLRIDAHQHFWRYESSAYPWIDDARAVLRRDYLPDELAPQLAGAGFDACVAVQARDAIEETRFLLDLADRYPFVAGVVGWVDLTRSDVRSDLARFTRRPKFVGVRHIVHDEPDDRFLLRADFCRGVGELADVGLTYDILIFPRHLPVAAEFVSRFPHQTFVLDHLAKPDLRGGDLTAWARDLDRLAAHPHVCAKISGLVTEADWAHWTPGALIACIEVAVSCFGPDRLMIGSDWPVCTLAADYARTMGVVLDWLAGRPHAERAALLGGTAARVWRLGKGDET